MDKIIMVACDLHDKNMLNKVAVDRGAAVKQTFENNRAGREAMIRDLKKKAQQVGAKRIVFAYEASGQGFQLHDELLEAGIECFVVPPTRIARSQKHSRSKTDEKDAERILELLRGHLLAGNELPAVRVPSLQQRDDQELTRCRQDLAEKQSRIKTQIRCLLKRNGVEMPSELGKGWTQGKRKWLKTLEAAGLQSGAYRVLCCLMRQLQELEKELAKFDKELLKLAKEERHAGKVQALRKLKGVGVMSALVFLVEMGDVKRFRNRRQVGSYMGLVPSSDETGERSDCKGHITRQGSARIRKALCQCAWVRLRCDPAEKEFYERLKAKNPKRKKVAVVAVMRRLAIRMWHAAVAAA